MKLPFCLGFLMTLISIIVDLFRCKNLQQYFVLAYFPVIQVFIHIHIPFSNPIMDTIRILNHHVLQLYNGKDSRELPHKAPPINPLILSKSDPVSSSQPPLNALVESRLFHLNLPPQTQPMQSPHHSPSPHVINGPPPCLNNPLPQFVLIHESLYPLPFEKPHSSPQWI